MTIEYKDPGLQRVIDFMKLETQCGAEGFITVGELSKSRNIVMIEQPCIDLSLCYPRVAVLSSIETKEELPLLFYNTALVMDKSFKRKKNQIVFIGSYACAVHLLAKEYTLKLLLASAPLPSHFQLSERHKK